MRNSIKVTALLAAVGFFVGCTKSSVNPTTTTPKHAAVKQNDALIAASLVIPPSGVIFSAVSLIGTNFSPIKTNNTVLFNGVPGIVNFASANLIIATVPEKAKSGKITVISTSGIAISANDFKVLHITAAGSISQPSLGTSDLVFDKKGNSYGLTLSNAVFKNISNNVSVVYRTPTPPKATSTSIINYYLSGIVVDAQGNIYVGENILNVSGVATNHNLTAEILKITPAGAVSVFVGGDAGNADGDGTNAKFAQISGLATDLLGNIYVGDLPNSSIRKVTLSGHVTTLAKTIQPFNITADALGDVYVNDQKSVQKVTPFGNLSNIGSSAISSDFAGLGSMLVVQSVLYVVNDFASNAPTLNVINLAGNTSSYVPGFYMGKLVKDQDGNLYNVVSSFFDVPGQTSRNGIFRYYFE